MKLAIIGSYGHCGVVLNSAAVGRDVQLSAVARWGEDDPLGFLDRYEPAGEPPAVYDDYRRMLDEVRPDIVGVFMPLYRNAEASIAAADLGCHVLSEKPLATTLEDLATLRETAGKSGVRVSALMTARAEPTFQAVRAAVGEGRIGQPILASAQKSYPFSGRDDFYKKRRTYGGSIPWQAIHALDFVSYCTGRDYVRVAAMHSNAAHPAYAGMEDNGGLLLELAGGGHATITFDYLRPWGKHRRNWGDDRLRIAGSEGVVEIADAGTRVELITPDAVEDISLPPAKDLLAEFVASVRSRGGGTITTEESFRITEVALKARDAADAGLIARL